MTMGEGKYRDARIEGIAFQEDEPWFLLRGQDRLTPAAMEMYAALLEAAAPGGEGAIDVRLFAERVRDWQAGHKTKLPD